jgi:hypothetical protein
MEGRKEGRRRRILTRHKLQVMGIEYGMMEGRK